MGGGGAIFHFSQKIGLKSTKNMRFCILHKPMGGLEPPPPPPAPPPGYATDLRDVLRECKEEIKKRLFCIWLRIFVVFPYQLYQASAVSTGGFRGTKSPSQRLLVLPILVNSEYFFETSCTDKTTGHNRKRNNNVQT